MEPLDDKELNQLLRKWEAPSAPATMRVATNSHRSPWTWLWSGRIHVPVPVGAAIVFGALAFWIYTNRAVTAPVANPLGNAIVSPAAPQVSPNPPAVTAALSGFQPVRQVEPIIVRVQP
jgi:hypothetical protein